MVQTHSQVGFADPGLVQILTLFDPLDVPFAIVEAGGCVLYTNPALNALLSRCGHEETMARLCDFVEARKSGTPLFLESGALNPRALPYLGRCRIRSRGDSCETVGAVMRLEAYGAAVGDRAERSAPPRTVLCTISPLACDSLAPFPLHLLGRWQHRIEEIADSFDIQRIGTKCCKVLEEMTGARAVVVFWSDGQRWRRAEQIGEVKYLASVPAEFGAGEDWLPALTRDPLMSVATWAPSEREGPSFDMPQWAREWEKGAIVPCKAHGDTLGLVFLRTESKRLRSPGLREVLSLVSFQTAQAIDHSRWFQMARASDSRSERLIENANAVILGVDLQGNVTLWNRKAEEVFGYSRKEILGRSVFRILRDGNGGGAAGRECFRSALNERKPEAEFETETPDKHGIPRHVVWTTTLLTSPSGAVLGLYAIGQDITQRKELERSLAASEERYRNLVETTHDLYWIMRRAGGEGLEEGELVFLNRALAGHSRDSLVGRGIEPLRRTFTGESWRRFEKACLKVLDTGRPVRHLETEHSAPRSNRIDAYLLSDLFPCREGEDLVGVQGLSIDVTERKEMEAQVLQAQKLESVGTLARGIAHDFNNIISGVGGFALLIEQQEGVSDKIRFYCKSLHELTRRAGGLTRQLQTYARQSRPQKRLLDLNQLVRQSANILEASVAKRVKIRLDLAEDLDWIEADRSQIDQVVMNLCINACDAMPRGGDLVLTTRAVTRTENDPDLSFDAPAGRHSVLQVRDTGVGMTREVRARIMDPFFTTKKTGTGLGLSAVYGIVKGHNAFMRVDSEVGVGTCFTLLFPATEGKRSALGEATAVEVRGGHETILVADDELAIRMVSEDILTTLGYRVVLAKDGEEAARIFQERPQDVDLVIMDLAMPNLSGRAAAKAIRLLRPDAKILFASGYTDAAQIESLSDENFHHFLAKPYSMFDLQAAVRRALDDEPPPQ